MDYVDGRIFWDPPLAGLSPAERGAIYDEVNRVIAALHRVDSQAVGLGRLRPARQLRRAPGRALDASSTRRPRPSRSRRWTADRLAAAAHAGGGRDPHRARRLPARQRDLPPDRAAHPRGARLGAVDARPSAGRLRLPLHDGWRMAPGVSRGIAGARPRRARHPDRGRVPARATARAPAARSRCRDADWNYYLVFNMFRLVGILQGIAKRGVSRATRRATRRVEAGRRARPLAELAWALAQTDLNRSPSHGSIRMDFDFSPQGAGTAAAGHRVHGRAGLSRPSSASRPRWTPSARPATAGSRRRVDRGTEGQGAGRGPVEPVPARVRHVRRRA